ncbi:phosphoenolpyruvate--protein phosphotransferase [Rhodohalobacter sp. SW132]|uniref:phosphoenolpyruvate--protein phosphotransferase n=1 Tax=Rhodohalobacter sp. SW132 TaxID=2293433 RepID=UPI001313DE26|nr:phosphoenolpyruvate--protein phosphotransferase [Rhodohalobacter sp. SW132]
MSTKDTIKQRTLLGTPGAGGRGLGRPVVLNREKTVVKPEKIEKGEEENELRFINREIDELKKEFYDLKLVSNERDVEEVIESQIQVLDDPELREKIREMIEEQHYKAIYAVFSSFNDYIQILENSGAKWLNDRTVDIISIRDQLIDLIRNHQPRELDADNAVIFAVELSPTEMVKLSKLNPAGIVSQKGGLTSHMVILAQSLGIPCVIGADWHLIKPERFESVLIDGDVGSVLFDPTDKIIDEFEEYQQNQYRKEKLALKWAEEENKTRCGKSFTIRGNIEFVNELPRLSTRGASGVGLLRTETILFESKDFDVQTQIEFYRQVAQASGDHPVIIRLFDAGGDKLPDNHEEEHNPFLGWRGIRMLLDSPDLLRQQYEAILKVSAEFPGRIKILVPMISHIEQINRSKEILKEVKNKLSKEKVLFDDTIPFGIMIEVPGIALMASEAADMVDFFSIGTNDLTQYMLAVDRGNGKISSLYQPGHPSVWRIINRVIKVCRDKDLPLSVCGEMASNPLYAACFMGMGLNDLSMTTNSIPAVKSMLCTHDMSEFRQLAWSVLKAKTYTEVELLFTEWQKKVELQQ